MAEEIFLQNTKLTVSITDALSAIFPDLQRLAYDPDRCGAHDSFRGTPEVACRHSLLFQKNPDIRRLY